VCSPAVAGAEAQRYGLIVSNVCDWTERNCGKCLRCVGGTGIPRTSLSPSHPFRLGSGLTADRFQKRRLCSGSGNARASAVAATTWPDRQSSFAIAKFDKYPSATVYCLASETWNFADGERAEARAANPIGIISRELSRFTGLREHLLAKSPLLRHSMSFFQARSIDPPRSRVYRGSCEINENRDARPVRSHLGWSVD